MLAEPTRWTGSDTTEAGDGKEEEKSYYGLVWKFICKLILSGNIKVGTVFYQEKFSLLCRVVKTYL